MMRICTTLFFILVIVGCGNSENTSSTSQTQTQGQTQSQLMSGYVLHEAMLTQTHLIDVDHHGLFIDFGTPAQTGYTFGDWRSGWGRKASEGDTTFSYVGQRGRIYFHADAAETHVVRFRVKPIATQSMTPYLNGEQLQSVQLGAQGSFHDVDFVIPADKVRAGENYLLFTFGAVAPLQGEEVSSAIDYVRVLRGSTIPQGDHIMPTYETRVREVQIGTQKRFAFMVRQPTTLSWYVRAPAKAHLSFGVAVQGEGNARVRVFATVEGGSRTEVFSENAGGAWKEANIDLERFAGQPVRLDFVAEGNGRSPVAWGTPGIFTPKPEVARTRTGKNVIVLLIDTQRADKMHPWNPRSRVQTPTIDALAQQGTVFELAHSPENWTKPSVASVLTGLYPRTHLARTTESVLPSGVLMMSEHLKSRGFTTGSFIANGYVSDRFGFNQGWDYYTNYIRENKNTDAENVFREAGNWIEQNKDKRFFVYIQTIDPHVPYDPPPEYLRMYDARQDYTGIIQPRLTADLLEQAKRRPPGVTFTPSDVQRLTALHDGEISQHDHVFGQFIERMKQLGLWDNTLLVITSDHGEEFNDHGSWGHGHSVYEELLHVPLLFRLPNTVPQGQRVPDAVGTLSIPATVLELTGVEPMPNVEAGSLVPYLQGRSPSRPAVALSEWTDDRRVITVDHWKLIVRGNLTTTFFDLQADPQEKRELAISSHPIVARYCRILLSAFSGAQDRAHWMSPEQRRGLTFQRENAQMDETLRGQLRALGYAADGT